MTRALAPQIAMKIVEHARSNRLEAGTHLATPSLAKMFNVSRVPVIEALNLLAKEGIVTAVHNRGFFLAKGSADIPGLPDVLSEDIQNGSDDALYYQLAEDWLSGKMDERISENELMRIYGVPRTRLIKVLQRAAEDLWLERLPGHGWRFQAVMVGSQAYEDGYRFRMTIEPAALLQPSFKVDQIILESLARQQLSLLKGGFRVLSRTKLFSINAQFHETIVGFSNNPLFVDSVRKVDRVRRLLDYRSTINRDRLLRQCSEHLELIELLQKGDNQTAAEFLHSHIKGALESKLGLIASSPDTTDDVPANLVSCSKAVSLQ
jgi:DNA-binding GntR family transcriptional regulator